MDEPAPAGPCNCSLRVINKREVVPRACNKVADDLGQHRHFFQPVNSRNVCWLIECEVLL